MCAWPRTIASLRDGRTRNGTNLGPDLTSCRAAAAGQSGPMDEHDGRLISRLAAWTASASLPLDRLDDIVADDDQQ